MTGLISQPKIPQSKFVTENGTLITPKYVSKPDRAQTAINRNRTGSNFF